MSKHSSTSSESLPVDSSSSSTGYSPRAAQGLGLDANSASSTRDQHHHHHHHHHREVEADSDHANHVNVLDAKVVFLGNPSSGRSCLLNNLHHRLQSKVKSRHNNNHSSNNNLGGHGHGLRASTLITSGNPNPNPSLNLNANHAAASSVQFPGEERDHSSDVAILHIESANVDVRLRTWEYSSDLVYSEEEQDRALRCSLFCIVTIDVRKSSSALPDTLIKWIGLQKRFAKDSTCLVVGTFGDNVVDRRLDIAEVSSTCRSHGATYIEVSKHGDKDQDFRLLEAFLVRGLKEALDLRELLAEDWASVLDMDHSEDDEGQGDNDGGGDNEEKKESTSSLDEAAGGEGSVDVPTTVYVPALEPILLSSSVSSFLSSFVGCSEWQGADVDARPDELDQLVSYVGSKLTLSTARATAMQATMAEAERIDLLVKRLSVDGEAALDQEDMMTYLDERESFMKDIDRFDFTDPSISAAPATAAQNWVTSHPKQLQEGFASLDLDYADLIDPTTTSLDHIISHRLPVLDHHGLLVTDVPPELRSLGINSSLHHSTGFGHSHNRSQSQANTHSLRPFENVAKEEAASKSNPLPQTSSSSSSSGGSSSESKMNSSNTGSNSNSNPSVNGNNSNSNSNANDSPPYLGSSTNLNPNPNPSSSSIPIPLPTTNTAGIPHQLPGLSSHPPTPPKVAGLGGGVSTSSSTSSNSAADAVSGGANQMTKGASKTSIAVKQGPFNSPPARTLTSNTANSTSAVSSSNSKSKTTPLHGSKSMSSATKIKLRVKVGGDVHDLIVDKALSEGEIDSYVDDFLSHKLALEPDEAMRAKMQDSVRSALNTANTAPPTQHPHTVSSTSSSRDVQQKGTPPPKLNLNSSLPHVPLSPDSIKAEKPCILNFQVPPTPGKEDVETISVRVKIGDVIKVVVDDVCVKHHVSAYLKDVLFEKIRSICT